MWVELSCSDLSFSDSIFTILLDSSISFFLELCVIYRHVTTRSYRKVVDLSVNEDPYAYEELNLIVYTSILLTA